MTGADEREKQGGQNGSIGALLLDAVTDRVGLVEVNCSYSTRRSQALRWVQMLQGCRREQSNGIDGDHVGWLAIMHNLTSNGRTDPGPAQPITSQIYI